jgi:uncharacterized delta-60 repeat protein
LEELEQRELLTAGFLDESFGIHGKVIASTGGRSNMVVSDVAVQSDGKIVVAGTIQGDTGKDFGLMRFFSDGTVDNSFGPNGNGVVETDFFGFDDVANSLVIQPDNSIVVAGSSVTGNSVATDIIGNQAFLVARYTSSGLLDPTFGGGNGYVTTGFHDIGKLGISSANSVALQPNGKIVVAGSFTQFGSSNSYFALARYNSDGSLDGSFGGLFGGPGEVLTDFPSGGSFDLASAKSVAIQPDGKIVAAGSAIIPPATPGGLAQIGFALARYYADGTPDSNFDADGQVTTPTPDAGAGEVATSVVIQPDGKILAAGDEAFLTFTSSAVVRRYNPDGSLDSQFGTGGTVVMHTTTTGVEHAGVNKVAVQSDGRILVAGGTNAGGSGQNYLLARFASDGTLDPSFSYDGLVATDFYGGDDFSDGLAILPSGKIILAGNSSDAVSLARYNGDPGQLQFSACTYSALVSDANALLTVNRTGGSSGAVSVDYATSDITSTTMAGSATTAPATAGSDYLITRGTVNFADGEISKIILIPLRDDGGLEGGAESFQVTLSNPTGGAAFPAAASAPASSGNSCCQCGCGTGSTCEPFLATVTIKNFKVVTFPVTATEGSTFSGKYATFVPSDPTINVADYHAAIATPDGTSWPAMITANGNGGFDVTSPHVFPEEGTAAFTVSINLGADTARAAGSATVTDAPLIAKALDLTVTGKKLFQGVVAYFIDADPGRAVGDYTATITWDDGTTSAASVGNSPLGFSVTPTAPHRFGSFSGLHAITVTILDHGASVTVTDKVKDPPARPARKPAHHGKPAHATTTSLLLGWPR